MQKNQVGNCCLQGNVLFKYLVIMKLITLILFVCCLQVSANGHAQEVLSLSLKNVNLKYAIKYIQKNSSYRFIYSDEVVPSNKKIAIEVQNASIHDVLGMLFESTDITYHLMKDNLIVLSSGETQAVPPVEIKGIVRLRNRDGSVSTQSGITVLEQGTSNGTTTNVDGAFSLTVKGENAVLEISYIGYVTAVVTVSEGKDVDVTLEAGAQELQDVVVTALGVTRQKKALSYATQSLKGSELSETRQVNLTSAMNGKVAGLTISKTNAGPGSSNRIIFRGNRSLANSNQPLIVIDGVRVDNNAKGAADVALFGGRDNGDGISNINPDDVESMSVLTGASAAALYGSDASNGVIIITTKTGKIGKGIGVQISSSATFEKPMIYPNFQNEYGQGNAGIFQENAENSWGPKMTGQQVEDWTGKTQSLTPQANNYKDFFRTGSELINSAAVSSGNEKSQTYFSYTNTLSKGIIPGNDYKRNNLNLRQTVKLTSKLTLDLKANYIVENIINRPLSGAANRIMSTLYAMPRSLRLDDIKNFETQESDGTLTQNYWGPPTPSFQNPYWSAYRNLYDRDRNRIIGLASLNYQITPELSVMLRSSIDYYADKSEEKNYNGTYWLTDYPGQGNYVLNKESNRQFNNDVLINFNKDLSENLNLRVIAGASLEQFNFERTTMNNQGLNVPNLFATTNAVSLSPVQYQYYPYYPIDRREKQSVYASAQLGFKNYLFLDVTGRNDWNSTLPVHNASYFFPSVGFSAVISEITKMPSFISFLKARASYAYVGNGTGFNQIKPSFTLVPGGNGGFVLIDRILKNPDLKPELTRSFEAGLEMKLFNNRFGADITYYKTNTINQIFTIPVPEPSGYAGRTINAGNIQNQGVEVLLTAKPINGKNFKWNLGVNFGANRNKVIRMDDRVETVLLSSPQAWASLQVTDGGRFGEIYTSSLQRNTSGQVIVGDNGLPLLQTEQTYYAGNYNPDWTGGITNSFSYKQWSLAFLIDMRKGGVVVSGTQGTMAAKGVSDITVAGRENGFVVPNSVNEDGSKNETTVSAQDYWNWVGSNSIGELFTYDATNVRLREASLTYALPSALLKTSFIKGASLSLIGRNLFFIKNNAVGFDPEASLGTGNNQGVEYSSIPTTRSYGVYLKFNF